MIAAGAAAGGPPTLIGVALASGAESYVVLALTGSLGYLAGPWLGWGIGKRGGRALLERHGRWLHLRPRG